MDPAFSRSIANVRGQRIKCLGLTLQPLTVGHLGLFLEHGCPFPEKIEEAQFKDLILGVLICSQKTAAKASRLLGKWWLPAFAFVWGWLMRRRSFGAERNAFYEYLVINLERPQARTSGLAELTAPLYWRLFTMLQADFHYTPEMAANTPLLLAHTLWMTEADRRGSLRLKTEREQNFEAWVQEQERIRLEREAAEQQQGGA